MSSFPKCGWRGVQPAQKCQITPASRTSISRWSAWHHRLSSCSFCRWTRRQPGVFTRFCFVLNPLPCFSRRPQGAWRKSSFFFIQNELYLIFEEQGSTCWIWVHLKLLNGGTWKHLSSATKSADPSPRVCSGPAELIYSNNFSDLIFLVSWLSSRQISCATFLMKQRNAWNCCRLYGLWH